MINNIIDTLSNVFVGNGIIIALGCFIVGMLVKGTFNKVPNKLIPYINIVVAEVLGFLTPGTFEGQSIPAKVVLLMFLGLSSTGLYEAACEVVKERFSIDIKQIYNNIIMGERNPDSNQTQVDVPPSEDDIQRPADYNIDIE